MYERTPDYLNKMIELCQDIALFIYQTAERAIPERLTQLKDITKQQE